MGSPSSGDRRREELLALGRHRCGFRLADGVIDLDGAAPPGMALRPLGTNANEQPFVEAVVGDVCIDALWDSGASRSVVDSAFAEQHPGLVQFDERAASPDGAVPSRDSAGIEVFAREGWLAPCSIGGVAFGRSPCVVIDLAELNAHVDRRIDLVIGTPIMADAQWWFDFPGRRWGVTRSAT